MAHLVVDCQVIVRKFPILTNSGKPKLIAREQYLRPASEFIQFTKDSIAVIIDQHVLFDWIELISDLVNSVPECPVFVITDSTRMNFRKSRAFRVYKAVAELIENDQKKRFLLFPDLFCLEAHNLPDIEHQGFEGYDLWQETNSIWKSIEILKQQGLKMVYAILNKKSEDLVRINAAESSDMKYITIEHLLFRVLKLDIPRIKDMHKSIEERIAAYEEERKMAEDEKDERSSVGYKKYASDELIKSMIESKEAFRGFFRVKKYNPKVAIVEINSEIRADGLNVNTREILICNRFDRNRSIDGDEVVVRLFDQRKWKNFHDSIESDDLESKDNLVKLAKDDEELGSLSSLSGGPIKPCGEIISILNRNMRSFVATLDDMELEESSRDRLICIPIDKRIPKIRIRTKQGSDLAGKRIVVAIDDWNIDSRYPEGHYLYTLGEAGKFITETQALLIENCIRHFDFKNENLNPFLSELPKSSEWKESCPLDALSNRKDLRNSHFVMSIDPPGCRDIDDALSVKELENGNLEFAVHIADVTYFLKQDSPLDLEARSRGTTVYLVNRPYNMLPEVLSEDVCSLHEGKDRLVVSVFWEVDPRQAYKMIRCYMSRSVIRSKFALSYYEAQNIIDGDESSLSGNRKNAFKECRKSLCSLLNFGRILRADRSSRGSLDLDSLEALYEINREAEDPDLMVADVRESKDLEIHHTVAEFMILANMAVAEFIYSKNPTCSLLRRHPVPEKHKFKDLSNILSANSLSLDTSSAISLARSLDEITTKTKSMDPYIAKIIKFSLIRLMSEAKYFSTGSLEKGEFLHYGLAGEYYTHFTSPIRRYADVVVHRILLASLEDSNNQLVVPFDDHELNKLCIHLNQMNRQAKAVQRDSRELCFSLFLKNKQISSNFPGEIVEAIVFDFRSNGVLVFVPRYQFKGPLVIQDSQKNLVGVDPKKLEDYERISCTMERSDSHSLNLEIPSLKISQRIRLFDHINILLKTDLGASKFRIGCTSIQIKLVISPDRKNLKLNKPPVNFADLAVEVTSESDPAESKSPVPPQKGKSAQSKKESSKKPLKSRSLLKKHTSGVRIGYFP